MLVISSESKEVRSSVVIMSVREERFMLVKREDGESMMLGVLLVCGGVCCLV